MTVTFPEGSRNDMRPLRIANCSGFFGDRMSALAEVAAEPGIDVITGDYLAEVTMLVLAKSRAKHPDGGYAATFLRQLEPALDRIAAAGIKVVSNAGGLNPHGLATALREMIASAGHSLSVAVVDRETTSSAISACWRPKVTISSISEGDSR